MLVDARTIKNASMSGTKCGQSPLVRALAALLHCYLEKWVIGKNIFVELFVRNSSVHVLCHSITCKNYYFTRLQGIILGCNHPSTVCQ